MLNEAEGVKASIHAKVEHPLRGIKQLENVKVRVRWLAKNKARLHTGFACQAVDDAQALDKDSGMNVTSE